MKKPMLFAAGLILCYSFLYADLTKAQLWAVSLPGILTEARKGYRNTLNDKAMNESGRDSVLETLRSSWDINTREELLETLDDLEDGIHHTTLMEIKGTINAIFREDNNEMAISNILNSVEWDQVKVNRANYVLNNWNKFRNITLKGWDLGRGISLCRWGYNVGFMTEDEAWKRIFHIASMVQQNFSSWEEYGYDFFMGRLFWASGFGQEKNYLEQTEPIYNRLLDSYWGWLDWDVDLDAEETAVPKIFKRFLPPDDNDGMLQYQTNDPALHNFASHNLRENPNHNSDIYEYKVKKISGDDDYGYGMVFCGDDSDKTSYYRFFITVNGRFTIQKRTGEAWEAPPVIWRNSSFLITGFGIYNTLRVERTNSENGANFMVFINNNLATSFNDNDPLNGNKIGPVVSVNIMEREQFPHIPVDVRFTYDEIKSTELNIAFWNQENLEMRK